MQIGDDSCQGPSLSLSHGLVHDPLRVRGMPAKGGRGIGADLEIWYSRLYKGDTMPYRVVGG